MIVLRRKTLLFCLGLKVVAAFAGTALGEASSQLDEVVNRNDNQRMDSIAFVRRLEGHLEKGIQFARWMKDNNDGSLVQKDTVSSSPLMTCDKALGICLGFESCMNCFTEMKDNDVDWATVSSDVSCQHALPYIYQHGHCQSLKSDINAEASFCNAFKSCVVANATPKKNTQNNTIDCSKLTSCDFEGIHKQFLGDGICHENLPGCYNTEICGFDGGDCCPDKCSTPEDNRYGHECGSEGYFCRDPKSQFCQEGALCQRNETKFVDEMPVCQEGFSLFRILMYDSFGDGWEGTTLIMKESATVEKVFEGALNIGSKGTSYVCLKDKPTCYTVETKGGIWGRDASWEIRPLKEGTPALASGGAPMSCEFNVAGGKCQNTCVGVKNNDPTDDEDYKDFQEMHKCVKSKCPIQVATCSNDDHCITCFEAADMTPDYCYSMEKFRAVLDCAMCQCLADDGSFFCDARLNPGISPLIPFDDAQLRQPQQCSPSQTIQGGAALLDFSKCTNFDQLAVMMIDFDQNNFGDLDTFEACAHQYRDREDHGGRTAQGCMKILKNAMNGVTQVKKMDDTMADAISTLASMLYHNAENFCDCALRANGNCPLCPSFVHFKTLLYESIDACISLDQIDCDAWTEFYDPCREELRQTFVNVNFADPNQCQFVHDGCGKAGPFPSFRRLDCQVHEEVSKEAWDFYQSYSKACLDKDIGRVGDPNIPMSDSATARTPGSKALDKAFLPERKPYLPPEKRDSPNASQPKGATGASSSGNKDTSSAAVQDKARPLDRSSLSDRKPYVPPEKRDKKDSDNSSNGSPRDSTGSSSSSSGSNSSSIAPVPDKPAPEDNGFQPDRKPYVPPESRGKNSISDNQKPYVPPESRGKEIDDSPAVSVPNITGSITNNTSSNAVVPPKKKQSHFWRNTFFLILFGYGAYYFYKRFSRQRLLRYYEGDEGAYHGLALESSTTFEPPFLPPPPSAADSYYSQQYI